MDLLKSNHTVPFEKADKTPLKQVINQTPQYATDGDPAQAIPATIFPAYHYNSLISEIVNAIKAGGKVPSNDDWGQLGSIITDILNGIDGLNGHFKNIKEVGKDEKGVYVIYTENDKDKKTYILSPSDLDDINKRLSAAEGTLINHTSRLDNYGDAIHRIFSQELPSKAALNGNGNQDFNVKELYANFIEGGGIAVHGGVFRMDAYLSQEKGFVRSWGLNQIPLNNNILQLVGFDKDDPENGEIIVFIECRKNNHDYNDASTLFIPQTLISPKKGDLSELYMADRSDYIPGQIMMFGGENEITLCTNKKHVFGVYSADPAFILNGEKTEYHIPIALTGRVPVLIDGPVRQTDKITSTDYGVGIASTHNDDIIIGRPIYDDFGKGTRLVECFVKAVL